MMGCEKEMAEEGMTVPPPFALYDTDSVRYSLKSYSGQPVIVHFWADWCPRCREEFPKMQKAYLRIKDRPIEILAINSGQSAAHVREIKETFGLTFPLLVDEAAAISKLYKVSGLPTTFFIDSDGNIFKTHIGWLDEKQIVEIFGQI